MITLSGQAKSTGQIYKYACRGSNPCMYMTNVGKTLKEVYALEARSQYKNKPSEEDLEVEIALYHGDKRKRDIDNFNKLILDALNGIIWVDDSQIVKLTVAKFYDKENPRIEVTTYKHD